LRALGDGALRDIRIIMSGQKSRPQLHFLNDARLTQTCNFV